jgi:type I restriction enzyme S subunit
LVTSIGATIGQTGFNRIAGVTNQQIYSIIPDSNQIIPEFLYFLCISPQFQESILKNSSSTTLPIINKSKFSKLQIPLFSIKEQEQIVSQIEQGFSLIESSQRIVNSTLQTLETMRMSVLKQAFQGKLVPQDPNDEPASVLLERIKKQKS